MSVTVNWKEFSDSLFFFQQNMLYAITIIFFQAFGERKFTGKENGPFMLRRMRWNAERNSSEKCFYV